MPIVSIRKSERMAQKTRSKNGQPITDKAILEFLNAQSEKTRKTYSSGFKKVLEFSKGETGAQMLEDVSVWSRKILAFQQNLISQGYSLTTVETMTGMLRGFFAYYRKNLDLSRADKRKLGRKARNSEDYSFSQEDIKKMANIASLDEKYVLLCGVSFGLRAEDFSSLSFGKYRLALETAQKEGLSVPLPLGKVNTEKEEVTAYPFISSDALPIITAILDAHKDAKDEDPVYQSKSENLTATLQSLVFKSGIETHGQRVRFHCLRKYLFDRIVSVSSDTKASQIIGHKISGEIAPYIGQGSLKEVYERASPSIVISNGNGAVKAKVEALSTTTEQLIKMLAERDKTIADLETKLSQSRNEAKEMVNDLRAKIYTELADIRKKQGLKGRPFEFGKRD
jgi:hypothetical protein